MKNPLNNTAVFIINSGGRDRSKKTLEFHFNAFALILNSKS